MHIMFVVISQSQMSTTMPMPISVISTPSISSTNVQGLSGDIASTVHPPHVSTGMSTTITETLTIYHTVTADLSLNPSPSQDSCGVSSDNNNNSTPIYIAVVIVIIGVLITVTTIIVGKVIFRHYQKRKQHGGLLNIKHNTASSAVQPLLVEMKKDLYAGEGFE